MTDDWQWFWASESGRDRILRDEVEGLQAMLSSASSRSHRLSSQLAQLSGSIESRLNALSRAFDAYVELGDVREELAAYDTPASVRRAVLTAIEALAGRRPATQVDPQGLDYWLPYAMNAVIGLVEGHPDQTALEQARALSPEADLFVVAACGALGHGAAVAELVPGVLICDQELTEHQRRVWAATATGVYPDAIGALGPAWRPVLEREPLTGWSGWVAANGPSPSAGISWVHTLVDQPEPPAPRPDGPAATEPVRLRARRTPGSASDPAEGDADQASPSAALRGVVSNLIGRGMAEEAELLRRARELRARIENPGAGSASKAKTEPVTVVAETRRALLASDTTPAVRAELLSWIAQPLTGVVDELAASAKAAPPTQETVRAPGSTVVVTPRGADPAAVHDGVSRLQQAYQVSNTPVIGWGAGTGVAALLALILGIAGSGWAWLFVIVTIGLGIGFGRQLHARRSTQRAGAAAVQSLQHAVTEATAKADRVEQQRTAVLLQLTAEASEVRERLSQLQQRPVVSPDR